MTGRDFPKSAVFRNDATANTNAGIAAQQRQ
jgi:hypothetical protein